MESSEENLSEPVECPHLHSLQDGGLVCTDCGQTFVSQILVDDAVGLSPQRLQRASNMGNEINGSFMAAKRLLKTNKAYQDRMEVRSDLSLALYHKMLILQSQ